MINPIIKKTITVNHPEMGHIEVTVEGVVTEKSGVADFKIYYRGYDVTNEMPVNVQMECLSQVSHVI